MDKKFPERFSKSLGEFFWGEIFIFWGVGSSRRRLFELESVLFGRFDAAVTPAAAAEGYVFVVATNFYLRTFGYHHAVSVDSGVDDGFSAAGAGRLDFVDGVSHLEESF